MSDADLERIGFAVSRFNPDAAAVLARGRAWCAEHGVTTWDAVVDGDPAFVRHTAADSGFAVGTFGGAQDGTFAAPELSPLIIGGRQARWASVAAAGGLAWLDLG